MTDPLHIKRAPLLIVVSGPSGAGKGTALATLRHKGFEHRLTYTTRAPRPGERDGEAYHFIDQAEFTRRRQTDGFAEYTRTYADDWYGAPSDLLSAEEPSPWVVELEPQGYHRVRAMSARHVVGIFVVPPSLEQARARITSRGFEANIGNRVAVMRQQVGHAWSYDYIVVNDDRLVFEKDIRAIAQAELTRAHGATWMSANWEFGDDTLPDASVSPQPSVGT